MKIKNDKKKEYVLSDFYAAVFLRSSGFNLIGINKSDPRRFNFIFKDKASRVKLLDDFFAGRAVVEPRRFMADNEELNPDVFGRATTMISDIALREFKVLWRDEFGKDISDEQATELATNLLMAFNHSYRPVRKEWLKGALDETEKLVVIEINNNNENENNSKHKNN